MLGDSSSKAGNCVDQVIVTLARVVESSPLPPRAVRRSTLHSWLTSFV